MKLISLNIWQGRIISKVVPFLEREQPDILCMQEVYSSPEVRAAMDNFHALEMIQQKLAYAHRYFSPIYSYDVAGVTVTFGNAILSRFPLTQTQTIFTHGHYVSDIAAERPVPNTRNLQLVTVQATSDKSFTLINHHAHWEPQPMGTGISVEKMRQVAELAAEQSGPLMVVGDLNVVYESPAMRVFDGLLENLTHTHNIKETLSILGKVPDVACDHILINQDVKVRAFDVLDDVVSDHKALALDFDI